MKKLTLIIPAKNESESLPSVLDELKIYNLNINIILQESDISTIRSVENYPVNLIYQDNKGYGDALIKGIETCTTDYFSIFNADGSFNPSELKNMLFYIEKDNYDFVFGSRYQRNSGSEDDTIITLIGNHIFTWIGRFIFNLNISDILYTFVVGKTDKAKKLNLKKKDFSFCVELPIKAKAHGMKIISSNSYERKRIAGIKKVNAFRDGTKILISMIGLFFKNK